MPSLIVDGGSLDYAFKGTTFKTSQIKSIAKKIIDRTRKTLNNNCIVVISHPDEDHYNWIIPILTQCKVLNSVFWVTHVYLGGKIDFYDVDLQAELKKLKEHPTFPTILVFPSETTPTTVVHFIASHNNTLYSLLPALPCNTTKAKNDASLVVYVEHEGKVCLLTGDATKKTTDHILAHIPALKTDVLLASHHGSSEEGCNDSNWLQKVKPTSIIISSGLKHTHPHEEAILRFQNTLPPPALGASHHLLAYGLAKETKVTPNLTYDRGYGIKSVAQNIFGTLRHGTITLLLKADGTTSFAGMPAPGDNTEKSLSILGGCLANNPDVFSLSFLRSLDLRNVGVSDVNVAEKDALIVLLKELSRGNHMLLSTLNFNDTNISHKDTIDALTELVRQNPELRKLVLQAATFPAPASVAITTAWNNRGLTFS